MPLNSIQLYTQKLLNNLVIPGPGSEPSSTLEAYITPPTVEDLNGPRAYIWGARQKVKRQTMPRLINGNPQTGGFKEYNYTVDIYLSYLTNPDDALIDQEFPILVDTVLAALWQTTMPVYIDSTGNVLSPLVGPSTPGASQVLDIGERWEMEYPPEKTPATLRMLYYTCRIGMEIQEVVQG